MRSPNINNTNNFNNINNNGNNNNNNASALGGVCFGFCIGQQPSTFATDSWETINNHTFQGTADTVYHVGDEKEITLTTGEKVTLQILGFNHDDLATTTGKAGITLGMKYLLPCTYELNNEMTNIDQIQKKTFV